MSTRFISAALFVFFINQLHASNLKEVQPKLSGLMMTTQITAPCVRNTNLNPLNILIIHVKDNA